MVTLDQGGSRATQLNLRQSTQPGVEFFWTDRARSGAGTNAWRIVADDAPHIVYAVSETPNGQLARLTLIGARTTFTDIDLSKRVFTAGARLHAGAILNFLAIPAHELTDAAQPVTDLLPRALRPLAEQILNDDPGAAPAHLGTLLRRAAVLSSRNDRRARWLSTSPTTDVDQVQRTFGISHRALRDWAHRAVGMSVKRLLRIQRLHRAVEFARTNRARSWSEVAAYTGYADQSHCIRDFQELLGETPAEFLARGEPR